jgi:hypothetical protein
LGSRLRQTAEILEKLRQDGWSVHQNLYDITCWREDLEDEEEVDGRLRSLGIDPKAVTIDFPEEEDEELLTNEQLNDLCAFLVRKPGLGGCDHTSLTFTWHWVRTRGFLDAERIVEYLRQGWGKCDCAVCFYLLRGGWGQRGIAGACR